MKGRDWYDFLWYLGKGVPLDLTQLKSGMIQSGHLKPSGYMTQKKYLQIYRDKVKQIDFKAAKKDDSRLVRRILQQLSPAPG